MSIKRQAPTELNHENWDREDSTEREDMGTMKMAPKEVLEKRVMRTAKRRSQVSSEEPSKSVFSGFGGFNKIQQSSFDFLANLTNGNKYNNGQTTTKNETAEPSSIFTSKSLSSSPNTGIFGISGTSGFTTKPVLQKTSEGSLFGSSSANTTSPIQSVFNTTKTDSIVTESPFKLQTSPVSISKPNVNPDASTSQMTSTIFGVPSNSSPNKSLFPSATKNSTLFCSQTIPSTSTAQINNVITNKVDTKTADSGTKSNQNEEKKLNYFSKLKGLNESVSDWIKKHVEETPLCILSPIFVDYEKYLKEIQEEYNDGGKPIENKEDKIESKVSPETKSSPMSNNVSTSIFGNFTSKVPSETKTSPVSNNASTSIFGNLTSSNIEKKETPQNIKSDISTKSASFNFGLNTSTTTTVNAGFSFGINSSTQSNTSSLFSTNTSTSTTNANTPFSFGINKSGFGFNATSPKSEPSEAAKDEDDEPPKVEFTPVIEENSVFDIKCKIFIKKDGNFVDKGVGTLYIKKIEDSGKHQLLVRANTNLGSVLLNLILSSSIPTQRMGKNNVMLVCIPTPDANPPPTTILIRVKTAEEADELLSTLNKYKA